MKKRIFFFTVFFTAATLISLPSFSLTVLQLNLEQLTALSEKVFSGRCLSVTPKTDSGDRSVEEVTFEVEEMIKGEPADKIMFKQLSSSALKSTSGGQGLASNLPQYKVGEEAVVFLSADGPLGLTAPVGLFQGKFKVTVSKNGEKRLVNGMGNHGLFLGSSRSPRIKAMTLSSQEKALLKGQADALPYDPFVSLVKKLAEIN